MSSSAMGAEKVMSGARNGPSKQGRLARQLELRAEESRPPHPANSSWGYEPVPVLYREQYELLPSPTTAV